MIDTIGFIAATLTTAAFIPQAYKVYKTKKTDDLSLSMFVMFSSGVFLWLVYGVAISSAPVVCANIITLLLALYILFVKLGERQRAKPLP